MGSFGLNQSVKILKSGLEHVALTEFVPSVAPKWDSDRLKLVEALGLSEWQESGLGVLPLALFYDEHFYDARRFDESGFLSDFTIGEIVRGCRHTKGYVGVCPEGGEKFAYPRDCGDGSCPNYQFNQNRLSCDVAIRDLWSVYQSLVMDFDMGFTSYVFTTSPFVREKLTEKFLGGEPVEADLNAMVAGIIETVFLEVVDDVRGRSRIGGIIHNAVQFFSSGKDLPVGKSKARAFLERGFAWHVQGFLLNIGQRKDGSIFRLSHVGRSYSEDELAQYRFVAGFMWKKALERYLGVVIPDDALNESGVLNVHFNYGTEWTIHRGGLANRLNYDNRTAHGSVRSLVNSGEMIVEMRRLRREGSVGYERAKLYLRSVLSIPDANGKVLGQRKKSSLWFGLFSGKKKKAFFKSIGVEFKSFKERRQEVYSLRPRKCPNHSSSIIELVMVENKFGYSSLASYDLRFLVCEIPDCLVAVRGGRWRLERWKQIDSCEAFGCVVS